MNKEFLIKKIVAGQTIKMLTWEFKLNKTQLLKFAKENNIIIRTTGSLHHAGRIHEKERRSRKNSLR